MEILETDKTLQNDLTDKDILPLAKVVRLLPKGNSSLRPFNEVKPCWMGIISGSVTSL